MNSGVAISVIKYGSRFPGTPPHAASSSKKPRSRGIFRSLFCCLCHDETDQLPVNNNAPLLVEENGTISKVRVYIGFGNFLFGNSALSTPESYILCLLGSLWLTRR